MKKTAVGLLLALLCLLALCLPAAAAAAADGLLLGSPTLIGDALPPVYEMLLGLNPVIHRGKFAGAFGSYAWSGEAAPNLLERMRAVTPLVTACLPHRLPRCWTGCPNGIADAISVDCLNKDWLSARALSAFS